MTKSAAEWTAIFEKLTPAQNRMMAFHDSRTSLSTKGTCEALKKLGLVEGPVMM